MSLWIRSARSLVIQPASTASIQTYMVTSAMIHLIHLFHSMAELLELLIAAVSVSLKKKKVVYPSSSARCSSPRVHAKMEAIGFVEVSFPA